MLIMIERFCTRHRWMQMPMLGGYSDDLGRLNPGSVTGCGKWRARPKWHQVWSPLSESVQWRCTWFFGSLTCLCMLWSTNLAWKTSRCVVLMKHYWLLLYRNVILFIPIQLNTRLHLFSDLGAWFLNEVFRCFCGGMQRAFFGQLGHIQREAHLGLFPH